ncbi:MAG TPA: DUF4123 domain-containing protein, partial [Cyclobacteriaceae bacterium]|nr:DUF4123 domain-containing protein [Cyclobacteriaceae bacterium]
MKGTPNFFLFDAARAGAAVLEKAMQWKDHLISLYHGRPEALSLETVAPYLFDLSGADGLRQLAETEGWGRAWGYFIASDQSLQELKAHFSRFLVTKDDEGKEYYFRFYDPRVLRQFLPSCEKKQLIEFFGPVEYFLVEGEEKEKAGAVKFWQQNGVLHQSAF